MQGASALLLQHLRDHTPQTSSVKAEQRPVLLQVLSVLLVQVIARYHVGHLAVWKVFAGVPRIPKWGIVLVPELLQQT